MIFISYRKTDSTSEARSLKIILDQIFGHENIFLDNYSIDTGSIWQQKIEEELEKTKILIAVIGPNWLKSSDQFGHRLIDKPNDWPRKEIEYAIEKKIDILPVLVAGASYPPKNALPVEISNLYNYQYYDIRDANWKEDIKPLISRLEKVLSTEINLFNVKLPNYCDHVSRILTSEELAVKLKELTNWTVQSVEVPGKKGERGAEIVRKFEFVSFADAIQFMQMASVYIDKINHHPKWENLWVTLIVHLSTWNIGYKVSILDFDLAYYLDRLFDESFNNFPTP